MLSSWQERLIFHRVAPNPLTYAAYQSSEIWIEAPATRLQGWRIQVPNPSNDQVMVYFGGNAEDISLNFAQASRIGVREAYFFNYRGYGHSQGRPSQAALYSDALRIYDFLVGACGINPDRLVLMGRSLGSAVATYLAAHRPVSKVVLVTPFDSILALAQRMFPLLPVRRLLQHPFPSSDYASSVNTPMLMVVARFDEVIPSENSLALYECWQGAKQLCMIDDTGHNDVHLHPAYYPAITEFLSSP